MNVISNNTEIAEDHLAIRRKFTATPYSVGVHI